MESFDGDPCHPLLPYPYTSALVEFTIRSHPTNLLETNIDLLFAREGAERRLRFLSPREVKVPVGQMGSWCRVYLADVRARQTDGILVRVGSFEPDWCVPSFWVSSVAEVAEEMHAEQ